MLVTAALAALQPHCAAGCMVCAAQRLSLQAHAALCCTAPSTLALLQCLAAQACGACRQARCCLRRHADRKPALPAVQRSDAQLCAVSLAMRLLLTSAALPGAQRLQQHPVSMGA